MLADIERQRHAAADQCRADRKLVERLVGRAVHLSQIEPQIVAPLQGGYALLKASWRLPARRGGRRVTPSILRLKAGGRRQTQWLYLLHMLRLALEEDVGVPLAHQRVFPGRDEPGSFLSTTDASGTDGVGGYVFVAERPGEVFLVAEEWPADIRQALQVAAAGRSGGAEASLSTVAAELFGMWAIPAAVAHHLGRSPSAVTAIGDCQPAVLTIRRSSGRNAQMAAVLEGAPDVAPRWLAVHVRRTANLDGDVLSHPAHLPAVARAVASDGRLRATCIPQLPPSAWQRLRTGLQLDDS